MTQEGADVVVIGAGLVGLLVAIELASRGLSVCVLERDRPGAHASGLNAGGLRTIGRHPAELQLSQDAAVRWRHGRDAIGPGVEIQETGHLLIAETEAEVALLDAHWTALQTAGLHIAERLDAGEIARLVPAMRPIALRALYAPRDGMADPAATVAAVLARARGAGVNVRSGESVHRIMPRADGLTVEASTCVVTAGCVVNAAGAFSGAVAALVGEVLPVRIEAPMAQRSSPAPTLLGPVVQTIGRKLTLKQLPGGRMLLGGGHRGGIDLVTPMGIPIEVEAEANRATAIDLFPALAVVAVEAVWAGLEGYTPDGLPVIGRSVADSRMVHVAAFCGHGFQLAPAIAPLVADIVLGASVVAALDAFRPDRFPAVPDVSVDVRAG